MEQLRSIIGGNNSGRNASAVAAPVLDYMIDMTRHITAGNRRVFLYSLNAAPNDALNPRTYGVAAK